MYQNRSSRVDPKTTLIQLEINKIFPFKLITGPENQTCSDRVLEWANMDKKLNSGRELEFMSWAFYFKCLIRGQNKDREGQVIG